MSPSTYRLLTHRTRCKASPRRRFQREICLLLLILTSSIGMGQDQQSPPRIKPRSADYSRTAFYPQRWRDAGIDFNMLAWEGENIVFLTQQGEYDPETMTAFVQRLDQGWDAYREFIGVEPRLFKQLDGKPTICAIPKSNLSCGYGCGFVGASGIEASAFYSIDLPAFARDQQVFKHYYFYEMGRNYFVFGDRHSLFTTGYAVFMRYVCMDRLQCRDTDRRTRQTIERCEKIYADSDIAFFDAFTNLGSGEKSNRLRDNKGRVIAPSDQPVMYATAMLKLRKDYGGDAWVKKFYHRLRQCKPRRAKDIESAKTQVYNWLVCASAAAGRDLTAVFADRWRMPLTVSQRRTMAETDWEQEQLRVADVVELLLVASDDSTEPAESNAQSSTTAKPAVLALSAEGLPDVIPTPQAVTKLQDAQPFRFGPQTRILVAEPAPQPQSAAPQVSQLGDVLAGELEILTGFKPQVKALSQTTATGNDILLERRLNGHVANDEAYRLRASSDGIRITARRYSGLAHGTSSLLQLLEPNTLTVPAVLIEDEPAAAFRNILIDVARNPISIGVIKDVVRLARLYKIRYVQLHLTDDQAFTFPFAPIIDGLKANGQANYSYTRAELEELVEYADARGVTLIPELELPGHSTKITQSGYLRPVDKNHAQIADPENFDKLLAIVDDVLRVFKSSPYFHMGGDESGAGPKLVPLIAAINQHVRDNPPGGKRRLLVWEGFHGAPTDQIPATGDDRVVVMAWESSYNAPWDLLNNGYQIINASWKPTYLTGGFGGLIHAGSTGGKRFGLEDLYRWDKNTFMHWEPGRAIYEDRGPNDPDRNDHQWNAEWIGKQGQIIGGMLLYWEQREGSTIHFIRQRLPILAQRLWNPDASLSFDRFTDLAAVVDGRIFGIVQPVEILPEVDESQPVAGLYRPYEGDSVDITLRNRTRIAATVRYSRGAFSGSLGAPHFRPVAVPDTAYSDTAYSGPLTMSGPFGIRAALVRADGTPLEGHSWAFFSNWPMRVEVTEFDIGGKRMRNVPDLAALPETKVLRRYQMPYVRGLMQNVTLVGQMTVTDFVAPADGEFQFELRTQSGHATLYVDVNQNGKWDVDEALIRDTPNSEVGQVAEVHLKAGQRYRLRLDHSNGMPRPVLNLLVTPPAGRLSDVNPFLQLPAPQP